RVRAAHRGISSVLACPSSFPGLRASITPGTKHVVLEMSEAESLVYAEVPGAGHVIVDAQTVANSQRKFGALRSQALPHEETVRFIEVRRGHLDD
ncbi:Scr1 family TA system antitoxin-like transcriptional regulator, partial [Nocardiopsis tropica]|uniref:Scr1 family TA system antitoxin-like transcriptional regulator n=1 Tax=Nocardiopsis tropica TaxID=109330 RepID=UPI003606D707